VSFRPAALLVLFTVVQK